MASVTHVQQKHNWDCGIACVMMVINARNRTDLNFNYDEICEEEGFQGSVWTIDLCYLLKRYKVNFFYYSTRLGVNPEYSKMTYYGSMMKSHTSRVESKIANASKNGIQMDERPVYLNDILEHLNSGKPVIALVNGNHLYCHECLSDKIKTVFLNMVTCGNPPYFGHYIVVTGYDINCKLIYFEDPLKGNGTCKISFDTFDKARTAYGTDEDVIFIF